MNAENGGDGKMDGKNKIDSDKCSGKRMIKKGKHLEADRALNPNCRLRNTKKKIIVRQTVIK